MKKRILFFLIILLCIFLFIVFKQSKKLPFQIDQDYKDICEIKEDGHKGVIECSVFSCEPNWTIYSSSSVGKFTDSSSIGKKVYEFNSIEHNPEGELIERFRYYNANWKRIWYYIVERKLTDLSRKWSLFNDVDIYDTTREEGQRIIFESCKKIR